MDETNGKLGGPPSFNSDDYTDWKKRFKAFLMRFDGAHHCLEGDMPTGGAALTLWTARNDKAYSYLVQATEKHPIAKTVVFNTESVVARNIFILLDHRFNIMDQSMIQAELSAFNSMKCEISESGEIFINRLNIAKSKLHHYGQQLDDDIHLLARLKDGLSSNARYAVLSGALNVAVGLTFSNACNQVISFDRRNPVVPVSDTKPAEISHVDAVARPSVISETANFVSQKKSKRQFGTRGTYDEKKKQRRDAENDNDDNDHNECVFCRKMNHSSEQCFKKEMHLKRMQGIIDKYGKSSRQHVPSNEFEY